MAHGSSAWTRAGTRRASTSSTASGSRSFAAAAAGGPSVVDATVAGNINEGDDLFAEDLPMPEIAEGDVLALLGVGSYNALDGLRALLAPARRLRRVPRPRGRDVSGLPVAHPWFHAEDAGEGVTRLWEPHIDELLESNVWHVSGADADLVVDFANGVGPLRPAVDPLTAGAPVIAVATHGHFDHVGGLDEFEDRRVHRDDDAMTRSPFPLRLRREDSPAETYEMYAYYGYEVPEVLVRAVPAADFDLAGWVSPGASPTAYLGEGDVVDLGDRRLAVLHTPGHTAGSICLFDEPHGTVVQRRRRLRGRRALMGRPRVDGRVAAAAPRAGAIGATRLRGSRAFVRRGRARHARVRRRRPRSRDPAPA